MLDELGKDVRLDRAALRQAPDGDAFQPGSTLEHLSVARDPIRVRDDEPGDDRFAESPTRLDHPLVRAGDRVAGEHHTSAIRVEQPLHHDGDTRAREEPDALAVGDRRVRVRRPPDLAQ